MIKSSVRTQYLINRLKGFISQNSGSEPKVSESNGNGSNRSENGSENGNGSNESGNESENGSGIESKGSGSEPKPGINNPDISEPKQEEPKQEEAIEPSDGSFESVFKNTLLPNKPFKPFNNIVEDIREAPPVIGGNIIISLKTIKEYINKSVNNITPK
jgi:hypothetical protein